MADRKNPDLNAQHQAILLRMTRLPENKMCADCHAPNPRWASTNLGIFVCMPCSGIHRKLGTHISQVRSITLDTWTPAQVAHFQKLGNKKAAAYFEACLPADSARPHSSDTNRMEAFIRDKYEHRRFITVENGGLGGASAPTRAAPSLSSSLPSRSHPRSSRSTYDDGSRLSRPVASSSYAARFSSTASVQRQRPNTIGSARPSTSSTLSTAAPDALQRAATLRELVNMGFSTTIALRAVQASQGDLQRAVDWVLANSGEPGNAAASAKSEPSAAVPKPALNLLDFDEPAAPPSKPAAKTNGAAAEAKANGTTAATAVKKPAAPPAHFTDFADFGDFASALPKNKAPSPQQAKPAPAATGLGALAELYKKGPPKPASPGRPTIGAARQPHQSTPSPVPRPLNTPARGVGAKPISPLPGTMRTEQWSPSQKADKASLGMPVIDIKRDARAVVAAAAKTRSPQLSRSPPQPAPKSSAVKAPPPPPPPPPMQEQAIISDSAPPPPSSPPPDTNGNAAGVPPAEKSEEKPPKPEELAKEEEDPFAALSMMALSSAAKPRKQDKPKVPEVVAEPLAKTNTPKPVTPAVTSGPQTGDFNLDEFFG